MFKYKYVLLSIFSATLAMMFLLGLGWEMGTAAAAPDRAATHQSLQQSSLSAPPVCDVEVDGDNSTDFTSVDATALQQAVDQATNGDTLKVAGACVGVQVRNGLIQTVYVSRSVTIQGGYTNTNWTTQPDPNTHPTILDAGGNGRVAYLPSGNTVVLDSLTLTGGNGAGGAGGGIFANTNVSWRLSNSIVSENTTGVTGGGIYNAALQFTMTNTTLINNTAASFGGGLHSTGIPTVTNVTNSVVENNSAFTGGGLHLDNGGILNINNTLVQHNHATNDGGGLAVNTNSGTANLTNSTFFSNTVGDSGAGIFNNGILNVNNSIIEDNEAFDDGGGLLNHNNGQATIMNSFIENNRVADPTLVQLSRGAGVYNRLGGIVTMVTSTVQYNAAANNGGGLWNDGTFNVASTSILSNTTGNDGGGIWNSGNLTVNSSQVLSNTSPANGGGLHNSRVASIADSTLAYNQANDGGAVYNTGMLAPTLSIVRSTIHDNNVEGPTVNRGAGIYVNTGRLDLVNSTISRNTASDEGSALLNNGRSNLTHNTVVSNTSTDTPVGSGLYNLAAASVMTLTNTAVGYNSGQECAAGPGTVVDNGYNLVQDGGCISAGTSFSADPLLGSLANNGGSTQTHLPLAFSPVIDAIPALSCGAANDQRSVARPVDGACDIGSVELDVNYPPLAVADEYTTTEEVTLTVAATGVLTNDLDGDFGPLTAVLDTDVTSGTLTLNPDGSFEYVPNADFCGVDSFTYHANDGFVDSNIVTVTLNVTCVNDAPVAVDDNYVTNEDTPLVTPAPGVLGNDTDVDGDTLTTVLGNDVMSGTLTLNPNGSFTYTPTADFCGTDSFTYFANDGQVSSVLSATVTLDVTCVNDAPVAVADSYTTDEDTTLNVAAPGVLDNDTDAEGNSLTAVLDSNVTSGTLTLNPDGSFDYTPNADFCGTDSFTYFANDGQVNSATSATVTLDVTCVNDLPVAVDNNYATAQDTTLNVAAPGVLGNDNDPDGDALTAVLDSGVLTGTLVFTDDGSFSYTPLVGWTGVTTFTYHANDGSGDSNTAVVTLTVGGPNNAPVAVADSYTTDEDTTLNVAAPGVLDNDTDAELDSLTAVLDSDVTSGTLTLNADGSFDYTPNADFCGTDSFTYFANDGQVNSATSATVTLDVTCINDLPVVVDDVYTTPENTTLNVAAPGVLSNDNDPDGDVLTAVLDSGVLTGTLVFTDDGSFDYTPPLNWSGLVTFTYHAEDGVGSSDTALVTIAVGDVNVPPVANDDSYATDEDTLLLIAAPGVLDNDSDFNGDSLTAVLDSDVTEGSLILNEDGSFEYTPNADFCGIDSFTYHANDGQTNSSSATVTIDVACINDAPAAVDDSYNVSENSSDNSLTVLVNDSDVDGDTLTITDVTAPGNGTAVISGSTILYTPDADFVGTDTFVYTVSDNLLTSTATVTITVLPGESGFTLYLPFITVILP